MAEKGTFILNRNLMISTTISVFVQVRSQDAVYGLAVSKEGREVAWKWLKVIKPIYLDSKFIKSIFNFF